MAAAAASSLFRRPYRQAPADATRFWPLTLGAVGVVYGDIGTSPIYAFREAAVAATADAQVSQAIVLGILSLIVRSLLLLVTLKYVVVLLRADLNGEGGTFALMSLAQSVTHRHKYAVLLLGIVGAAFLYGDAALTPALSVMSAVEGLKVIAPQFDQVVAPLSIAILIGLFAMQSRGTGMVGAYFGPIIGVWFAVLAAIGLVHICENPGVLAAFNPIYGVHFLLNHGLIGFTVLGLVFLAVTGAEALYADLGHFGRRPIQMAWLCLALPALTINYFGQGALVLSNPKAVENPFFLMFPSWALWRIAACAAGHPHPMRPATWIGRCVCGQGRRWPIQVADASPSPLVGVEGAAFETGGGAPACRPLKEGTSWPLPPIKVSKLIKWLALRN